MQAIRQPATKSFLTVLLIAANPALGQQSSPHDPGGDVLTIFRNHCIECHDPGAKRIRGDFDYVLDLERIAANRHMVVAADPAGSHLFELVQTGEMPHDRKSLSTDQVKTIGLWIASLAPTQDSDVRPRFIVWLGHFHPAVVHFPIALLVAAAVAEILRSVTGTRWLSDAARFCVVFGAVCAVPAAMLGWADAGGWSGDDLLTRIHRWTGTGTVVWAVLTAILSERWHRRGSTKRRTRYRAALFVGAVLVLVTAFYGGAIVHGMDHYGW